MPGQQRGRAPGATNHIRLTSVRVGDWPHDWPHDTALPDRRLHRPRQDGQARPLRPNRGGTSTGVCDLSCQPGTLVLRLSSDEEHLAHLEEVIGIHLARFGAKQGMVVRWERGDGTPGTTQGPVKPEDR